MATRDTRKAFDEIVARLVAESPSLAARPRRGRLTRLMLTLLAVMVSLMWGGLSVLMVVWGLPGVLITCLAVAAVAGAAWRVTARR
ncbi:hypothetical protein ADL15_47380 [Actinoplanes awajinensis subsp. mycoplanecinus]|uniref:DUF3040 domain-containing protein n=1 Tax=Actinoplanes awajinensis subsp. mycoplanecinus TaxID=135947 RepID=A0A101J9T8_9ACTN|nr:hypothetical protein ADL15_47380 [Actinoplanes awajinensis subsp. mycoplanecinus]